jgi:hypothetical protein
MSILDARAPWGRCFRHIFRTRSPGEISNLIKAGLMRQWVLRWPARAAVHVHELTV